MHDFLAHLVIAAAAPDADPDLVAAVRELLPGRRGDAGHAAMHQNRDVMDAHRLNASPSGAAPADDLAAARTRRPARRRLRPLSRS